VSKIRSLFALLILVSVGLSVAACNRESKSGAASSGSSHAATTGTGEVKGAGLASVNGLRNDNDDDNARTGDSDEDGDNNKDKDKDSRTDYKSNNNSSYHDGDDEILIGLGHAASVAEGRRVAAVVRRYYTAAAAADGKEACRLMYPVLAKAIPEDEGKAPGPADIRGTTCPVVMSKVFKHLPSNEKDLATVKVTEVRIDGDEAHALLGSKTMPASFIILQRDGRAWKVDMLLGRALS